MHIPEPFPRPFLPLPCSHFAHRGTSHTSLRRLRLRILKKNIAYRKFTQRKFASTYLPRDARQPESNLHLPAFSCIACAPRKGETRLLLPSAISPPPLLRIFGGRHAIPNLQEALRAIIMGDSGCPPAPFIAEWYGRTPLASTVRWVTSGEPHKCPLPTSVFTYTSSLPTQFLVSTERKERQIRSWATRGSLLDWSA